MKLIKKLLLPIIGGALLLMAGGCGKGFLTDLAVNPNNPSQATPQLLLPGILNSITSNVSGLLYENQAAWFGYLNYSGGYTYNLDVATYKETTGGPSCWNNWWTPLDNLAILNGQVANKAGYEEYWGITKILRSLCFQYLVDAYDKVPYSGALQGAGNLFPKYDDGATIYKDLVAQVDSGLALIHAGMNNKSEIAPGNDDIMWGGDMTSWLAFGNTVKLRMLVTESNVLSQSAIQQELATTSSDGYLGLGQDALVNPGYSNSDGKQNPIWSSLGTTAANGLHTDGFNYRRSSQYAMDFYKNTNDPRLAFFYGVINQDLRTAAYFSPALPPADSNYNADPFGTQLTHSSSPIGPGILKGPSAPGVVMLASESLFLQAEAAYRGYISGDPGTLYDEAIQASFEYIMSPIVSTSDADAMAQAYYSQNTNDVNYSTSTNKIEAILTQKWAALNNISSAEAWNDWRRTGFPVPPVSTAPAQGHPLAGPNVPYRYYYPDEEYQNNADAVKAATGGQTQDPYTTKIFWMPH